MKKEKSQTVKIQFNGKMVDIPAGCSMDQLADRLGISLEGTAVELNGMVLSAGQYSETILVSGDCLELVRLVGGG